MLVLGRKAGEGVVLTMAGLEVTITVVHVKGHRARIGIEAPELVHVRRSEVAPLSPPTVAVEPVKALPTTGQVA